MRKHPRVGRFTAAAVALGLLVASCGDDDDESSSDATAAADATTAPTTAETAGGDGGEGTTVATTGAAGSTVAPATSAAPADDVDLDAEMTIAVPVPVPLIDPHLAPDAANLLFIMPIYDRLTEIDNTYTPVPSLATSWEFAEDGSALEMELRTDVTFHDGTPFTADVVVASIERAKTIEGGSHVAQLASVESVEAIDDDTVRFNLAPGLGADLPAVLAGGSGAMISPAAIADGRDLNLEPGDAGSGPYLLTEWTPREHAVFERPEGRTYWNPARGRLARLEVNVVLPNANRLSAVESGAADLSYVTQAEGQRAKELIEAGTYSGTEWSLFTIDALWMRQTQPALSDLRTREAVVRSIDREAKAEALGPCTANPQLLPKEHWAFDSAYEEPYPFDPDAAKALAQESGASSFEMLFPAGLLDTDSVIIQGMVQAAGIDITLTGMPHADTRTTFAEGNTDAVYSSTSGVADPAQLVDGWLLGGWAHVATGPGADAEAEAHIRDLAAQAVDPRLSQEDRAEIYHELFRFAAEQAWYAPTCNVLVVGLHENDVIGLEEAFNKWGGYFDPTTLARKKS